MNFVSFEFAAFLAVVYVLHWSCRHVTIDSACLSVTPAGTHLGDGPQRATLSKIPKM